MPDHDQPDTVEALNVHLLCPDCTAKVDAAQAADPTTKFDAVRATPDDGLWHAVPRKAPDQ